MKLFNFCLFCIFFAVPITAQSSEEIIISQVFKDSAITGTFVLYNQSENKYLTNDPERANTPFIPASTFKIFNSLAALETGVVKNEEEIIKWDGVIRGWDMWNRDHNLRTAIKYSVVWFYQELARRIGEERMQDLLDKSEYGNKNTGGGIDLFWLEGDLKISPVQQIEFLRRLYSYNLPFSKRTIDIVKDIMIREKTDKYSIHAKTGWAARVNPQVGWFTGYVEKENNVFFFALNMDIKKDEDAKKREEITYLLLNKLNVTK